MKLYDIPRDSRVYAEVSDGSRYVTFHRVDGSYSLCTSEKGALCHLYASSDLRQRDDGHYELRLDV